VLRSVGARVVTPEEEPWLHSTVDRLVAQAEIPKPRIAVARTDVPNAFATGRNPKNSVICITDGIRTRLNDDELEAVIGHELIPIKNRDVTVMTLASFFATVAFMLAYVASVLVYFLATLLILALSRYREYGADRGGAILIGAPSRLASALTKITGTIARIPTQDLRKMETANAFCIVSALKGESLAGLFSSHPPVGKRVERLRRLEVEMEGR
jgi:heat shock protein HtpX